MASVNPEAAQQRYSAVAVLLHWTIALALGFQLALGFAMPKNDSGFALFQLHKSVGITILLLSLARLAWRLTHRPPPAVEGGFQGFLARAVHALLYVFMIGMPLTGWAVVSTSRIEVPTLLFGVVPWPHLPISNAVHELAEEGHELLAWIGIALIVLHVAGALRHQLFLKDGLLRRIAPGGKAWVAGLLALAVVVVYFATGMKVASDVVAAGGYEQQSNTARVPLEASPTATPTPEAAETTAVVDEPGPPPVWTIQPGGRLGFSVAGGDGPIRGSFSEWSGTIRMDPDNPESAEIVITVGLASAALGDASMDATIEGPEFFDILASPTATWRSTSVRRTGPGRYSASGTLSLKGASRSQPLTFTLSGNGLRRRVEGSASIDRTAFEIGTGESAPGVANAVSLDFAFDAVGRAP